MSRTKTCVIACIVASCASHAFATLLGPTGPLSNDTNAIPGWSNTVDFANTHGLSGTIEFAVWAPGSFPVGNFLGYTPTPGDYVYTYQAHEAGTADLSQVSVTLTGPVDNTNIGDFVGNDGFGPVVGDASFSAYINPFDSANWLFDAIVTGGSTDGLAFSSPNGPTWTRARNVDDGTVAFAVPVPSPLPNNVPEPGTLTLASCGLAVMVFQWLRRRRRLMSV
jgi:hypothetical protein